MPRLLATQKDLREAYDPGFCYLCGKLWAEGDNSNRDHVPPKRLFERSDRINPLTLRTHVACNNQHSPYDEQIGQAVALLWKKAPGPADVSSLRVSMHTREGMAPFAAVEGLNLRFIVARWLKGFHAALYREFLPNVNGAIHEPFPGGSNPGEDTILHVSHPEFVRKIKKNRVAGRVDTLIAYNGKCRYECTWSYLDDGRPMCIWALDIYAWHKLGDTNNFPPRSCVGWYAALNGIPHGAACATNLHVVFRNTEPLNAFEA